VWRRVWRLRRRVLSELLLHLAVRVRLYLQRWNLYTYGRPKTLIYSVYARWRFLNVPGISASIRCLLMSRKRAIIATAAFGCALMLGRPTSPQKEKTSVPLSAAAWTVDLRSYGYGRFGREYEKPRLGMFHSDVSFLNDDKIVDTFLTTGPAEGPQEKGRIRRVPRLEAVVLDPASGQLRRHFSWVALYPESQLVPRADGSFVVFLGDRLEFYSADFTPRSALKLTPAPAHVPDGLWFSRSPSGTTILIQEKNGDHISCLWVTGEAATAWQEKCELSMGAVVSDEEVAAYTRQDAERNNVKISIKTFQGPWRTLCTSGYAACNNPQFVTNDTLLLSPGAHSQLRLVREDGKTMFDVVSPGLKYVNSYSQKSSLLVVPLYDENGFAAAVVYDVSTRKRLFEVKNERVHGIRELYGLAISSRGDRLAVQGDGILRCYNLPARSTTASTANN
jgi:hypothetical protein